MERGERERERERESESYILHSSFTFFYADLYLQIISKLVMGLMVPLLNAKPQNKEPRKEWS